MHCIWHLTHDLWHLNTLSNSSGYYISYQTEYIWQHIHCISAFTPRYRSYNPHCVYDNTGTICMTSCEYIWYHIHSLWYHTTLWHSHTLYSCHHTQDTCHHIHCSSAITYSLLIRSRLQYVCYQTTICMTSYEFYTISQTLLLTSKDCIHDITSTIFRNTEPTVYDITYTTLVTSQPL